MHTRARTRRRSPPPFRAQATSRHMLDATARAWMRELSVNAAAARRSPRVQKVRAAEACDDIRCVRLVKSALAGRGRQDVGLEPPGTDSRRPRQSTLHEPG